MNYKNKQKRPSRFFFFACYHKAKLMRQMLVQKEKKKTSDGKPAYSIVITPCIENKPSTEEISLLGYPMSPTFSDCWVININLSHPAIQLWVSGKDPNIIQENIGRTQKMNPCYLLANTLSG